MGAAVRVAGRGKLIDDPGWASGQHFSAKVDGVRLYWSFSSLGFPDWGLIRSSFDPAEFAALRGAAEELRGDLDRRWQSICLQQVGGGFAVTWEPPARLVELYYHAPTEHFGRVESALQIGVSHPDRSAPDPDAENAPEGA